MLGLMSLRSPGVALIAMARARTGGWIQKNIFSDKPLDIVLMIHYHQSDTKQVA